MPSQNQVLNVHPYTPFLGEKASSNQVTFLALSMHEGNENVGAWGPIDTTTLGINGSGRGAHGGCTEGQACASGFTLFRV